LYVYMTSLSLSAYVLLHVCLSVCLSVPLLVVRLVVVVVVVVFVTRARQNSGSHYGVFLSNSSVLSHYISVCS